MEISCVSKPFDLIKDDLLIVPLWQGETNPFESVTGKLEKRQFEGKLGQVYSFTPFGKLGAKRVVLYGLGEEKTCEYSSEYSQICPSSNRVGKTFEFDSFRAFGGSATRIATSLKTASLTLALPNGKNAHDVAQVVTEGLVLANYHAVQFKSKHDDDFEVQKATIIGNGIEPALKKGQVLAESQNWVRVHNENPANIATPEEMVEYAKKLSKEKGFSLIVFDKEELKKKGMNAILAVNQGSARGAYMVIMEYNKDKKNLPLYCVVGKGITFDSGGLSLKPATGMMDMKYDKTGAVTTMGIAKAVAELNLPIRLVAAFTVTENLPSGTAIKPGDIVKAYNGKTIEIMNTDAEGRLILADTLAYMVERKPEYMVNLATLTGAIIISLGPHAIGLFSNNDELALAFSEAGYATQERVWRMPLWKEYGEMIKGQFADIKNIGSDKGEAGSITAAMFLKEFVGDTKWAHLDIAGVDNIAGKHAYLDACASGIGVRLVVKAFENLLAQEK